MATAVFNFAKILFFLQYAMLFGKKRENHIEFVPYDVGNRRVSTWGGYNIQLHLPYSCKLLKEKMLQRGRSMADVAEGLCSA